MIQTVLCEIQQEQLSFCHSHEHLFIAEGHPAKVNPALKIDDYNLTIQELKMFADMGGSTIIDAQPGGAGRMEKYLVNASKDTEVQIIASTGFHKLIYYPEEHWIKYYTKNKLIDVFVHELKKGMFVGTDNNEPKESIPYLAGLIKVAIDEERMQDPEKKLYYAAAEASKITGTPIMCHTENCEQGLFLAEFFLNLGVKPDNIIICHLDKKKEEINKQKEIGKLGVFLEYDTIGRFKYHTNEDEVKMITQLLEWGLEDQILLGLDTTRTRLKSYGGEIGLDYIKKTFIPIMKQYGIERSIIDKFLIHNPTQAFSKTL